MAFQDFRKTNLIENNKRTGVLFFPMRSERKIYSGGMKTHIRDSIEHIAVSGLKFLFHKMSADFRR